MSSDEGRLQDWADRLGRLYTPVVADVLDRLGYREQSMRADIRPLFTGARTAGVARTVQIVPAPELSPAEPYKGEMAAVDDLGPGDVMVVSACDASFWGELLSTAARYRECRGVVIDGYTRDTRAITAMGFPVFCRGFAIRGTTKATLGIINYPVNFGKMTVFPGDLIVGDEDGMVVVRRADCADVLQKSLDRVAFEDKKAEQLKGGVSSVELNNLGKVFESLGLVEE